MSVSRNAGFISGREQEALRAATVAIAGVGGDGGQVAEMLARLGVGHFRLADPEAFEEENLNRQAGSFRHTIGRNKAEVLAELIWAINRDATVELFPQGIQTNNVTRFVTGATLVIDETEYTRPELAVMLARAAREAGLPLVTGLNVGFGAIVTSFAATGYTVERYLGIRADTSLVEVQEADIPLTRWLTRLPAYGDPAVLDAVSAGAFPAPSVVPGVATAAAVVVTEAFNHITGRRRPVFAPRTLWVDVLERRLRTVRMRHLSVLSSVARMALRTRIGLNERTMHGMAEPLGLGVEIDRDVKS